ncbi:hypothetical protein [Micromonospora chersina]|uniref:hypothetical protein n=1 Tax=Micromonospora chersina TaxID=47854 RepID=UPI003D94C1F2
MAAAGTDRLGDLATDRAERRSRIRDDVAAALRDRGHEVRTSHGLSDFTVDLAVRRPGSARWQVAVMLDGPDWSARPTVADRDLAPALLRTIMGWPEVVRFWLPAWIHDRSPLLDRVDDAVATTLGQVLVIVDMIRKGGLEQAGGIEGFHGHQDGAVPILLLLGRADDPGNDLGDVEDPDGTASCLLRRAPLPDLRLVRSGAWCGESANMEAKLDLIHPVPKPLSCAKEDSLSYGFVVEQGVALLRGACRSLP